MGAALLTLGSCTNQINEEGFVDKANTISFNAYPNKTRAVDGDVKSDNMKGDNFGVVGYNSNSIYLGSSNAAIQQTWKTDENVTGGGSWEYMTQSDLKFWPSSGTMRFFAYFPFSDNATFSESISENGTVMTIPNLTCNHDVLFASTNSLSYQERVPLTFYHAFSKIKTVNVSIGDNADKGYVKDAGVSVEIQKVEFINTSTKGDVKVNNSGVASYSVNPSNVTLSETLASAVTINNTNASKNLIDNGTNAKGYLFATNSSVTNSVIGTGNTMWNGTTTSWADGTTLENLGQVCLKLTCKVWNGTDSKCYYVGGDGDNNYGEVYIPLKGTDSNNNSVSTFEAGKRYIYNIVFKDNVGFRDNGDPVLRPILFKVEKVSDWSDVTVTITL